MNTSNYTTKFGTLTFSQKVGDEYFWEASYQWVAKALSYFQEQLLICSDGFHLSEEEKQLLSVPLQEVPFESLQFLFYDNKEWILHFAGGGFSFCEPYGVSFHFKDKEPILIENLEDAEEI